MPNPTPSAETLILIPGLFLSAIMWQKQAEGLAGLGPIHLTEVHRQHAAITEMADAILQRVDGPLAVCGLSMGGYIALELHRRAPQRVTRLALLSTSSRPEAPEQTTVRDQMIALGHEQGEHAVVDALWQRLVHPERRIDEFMLQENYRMAEQTGIATFEREQNAIKGRRDQRPHLSEIRCPTLIVCGRQDALTPLALSEEMHAAIPHSRLVVLEDCGHLSAMERPAEVNEALAAWWTGKP